VAFCAGSDTNRLDSDVDGDLGPQAHPVLWAVARGLFFSQFIVTRFRDLNSDRLRRTSSRLGAALSRSSLWLLNHVVTFEQSFCWCLRFSTSDDCFHLI
jgi:hypothetical protein